MANEADPGKPQSRWVSSQVHRSSGRFESIDDKGDFGALVVSEEHIAVQILSARHRGLLVGN